MKDPTIVRQTRNNPTVQLLHSPYISHGTGASAQTPLPFVEEEGYHCRATAGSRFTIYTSTALPKEKQKTPVPRWERVNRSEDIKDVLS